MSEPQPTSDNTNFQAGLPPAPPLPATEEPVAYRPISGWAIAGCVISALFAVLVAISLLSVLFLGAPIFFPMGFVGIAVLGCAVSYYGQRHVVNSEGTRAGGWLAQVGIWLSVVSVLIYCSYYFATGLALQNQANDFLLVKSNDDTGFFPRLQIGESNMTDFNIAFLLTQTSRSGRPDDERSMRDHYDIPRKEGATGDLSQFRESVLARLFYKDLAKDAVIEPLPVQEWRFGKDNSKVYRNYRIKTKEVDMVVQIPVWSIEAQSAGQGRRWFVNLNEVRPIAKVFTPLGESVSLLRASARDWLLQKVQAFNEGETFPGVTKIDKTPWDMLPGVKKELRSEILNAIKGPGKTRIYQFTVFTQPDDPGKWEQVDGKIRFFYTFGFDMSKNNAPPVFHTEGVIAVESRNAIDPAHFDRTSPPPAWDIVRLSITTAGERKGP